jgi:hypothetical protein
MRTIGLHPKVALPSALLALAGAIVLCVALATGDSHELGVALSLLAAAGVNLGGGWLAPPGSVHTDPITPSDDGLSHEAHANIANQHPDGP